MLDQMKLLSTYSLNKHTPSLNEQTGPHVVLKHPNSYLIIAFSAVRENPIPTSSYPLYTCLRLRLTGGTSSIHTVLLVLMEPTSVQGLMDLPPYL